MKALDLAQATETKFERDNNVVMTQDERTDVAERHLALHLAETVAPQASQIDHESPLRRL